MGQERPRLKKKVPLTVLIALLVLATASLMTVLVIYYCPLIVGRESHRYEVTWTLKLLSDSDTSLQVNVSLPQSTDYQEIGEHVFSLVPQRIVTDEHLNLVACFAIPLRSEQAYCLTVSFNATVFEVLQLGLHNPGLYDVYSEIYTRYTRGAKYIESDNARIVEKAKQIVGAEQNPVFAGQRICDWIHSNIDWTEYSATTRGALWALENGQGDCSEKSMLFIAFCRATGIPARPLDGIAHKSMLQGGTFNWSTLGHDWAEIYVPHFGWIWVDPTWGWFGTSDIYHIALHRPGRSSSLGESYRYRCSIRVNVEETFEIRSLPG